MMINDLFNIFIDFDEFLVFRNRRHSQLFSQLRGDIHCQYKGVTNSQGVGAGFNAYRKQSVNSALSVGSGRVL